MRRVLAVLRGKRSVDDAAGRAAEALERGRPEQALAALDVALMDVDLPLERRAFAHNKRGVALIGLGRRDDALAAFCEALSTAERFAPALVNVGNLLLEDGDVHDAIEHYRAAIRADESYPGAYLNLAVALRRIGRANEAARYLRKALRLEMRRRS